MEAEKQNGEGSDLPHVTSGHVPHEFSPEPAWVGAVAGVGHLRHRQQFRKL
jgi:hypothetical protein